VKELIALARSKPGQLNCATGATGSSNHLAAELFRSLAQVDIMRIPYKGSGPALNDLLAGQLHIMFPTTAAGLPHVKSGRLKALAVTSLQPSTLAPGLPTVAESVPGYESIVMYALLAPAKTPPSIIDRLQSELAQYFKSPGAVEKLTSVGVEPVASSPRELASAMASEMDRLGKLIKEARLRSP
jgi:tripartite-type tricarboxylate transporter receptor subunit TctC